MLEVFLRRLGFFETNPPALVSDQNTEKASAEVE